MHGFGAEDLELQAFGRWLVRGVSLSGKSPKPQKGICAGYIVEPPWTMQGFKFQAFSETTGFAKTLGGQSDSETPQAHRTSYRLNFALLHNASMR